MAETAKHSIIIENRGKTVMTGVKDVESFNESAAIIITDAGGLKLKGRNIEIVKVDTATGELEMTGIITSVQYSDTDRTPNNLITKLFK